MIELEEDIKEEEVECVFSNLLDDKIMGWDRITNEFLEIFEEKLKCPLTMLFQEVRSFAKIPKSWKFGLVKLTLKVASLMPFIQWRPI